jgi:hypothetical protein
MKTKSYISLKNKTHSYTLERVREGVIHLVAKDARIDQEFLAEDLSGVLLDLPNLILAEQTYNKNQSDTIRFRISSEDKRKIEKQALAKGYTSVSGYLRDLALG